MCNVNHVYFRNKIQICIWFLNKVSNNNISPYENKFSTLIYELLFQTLKLQNVLISYCNKSLNPAIISLLLDFFYASST